jgi:uncharacterized protein
MNQVTLKSIEPDVKGSYLWEVKGGNARMYLMGTVHIIPKNYFPLRNEIVNIFDTCNNLVLEIILDESIIKSLKITDDIIYNKDYTYDDGDSLYNHYPKEKIINLRDYLVNNGLCSVKISKKFYKLKPDVVKELLFDGLFKKIGIDQDRIGIDHYFMKRARSMKKTILELETEKFQEDLLPKFFKRIEIKDNDKETSSFLISSNKKKTNLKGLPVLNSWFIRHVGLRLFTSFFSIMIKSYGMLYDNEQIIENHRKRLISKGSPLLGSRDEKMCNKIENLLMTKDSYFVAVGAMHLIGEGSIIDRLEKKGFEVKRIF